MQVRVSIKDWYVLILLNFVPAFIGINTRSGVVLLYMKCKLCSGLQKDSKLCLCADGCVWLGCVSLLNWLIGHSKM